MSYLIRRRKAVRRSRYGPEAYLQSGKSNTPPDRLSYVFVFLRANGFYRPKLVLENQKERRHFKSPSLLLMVASIQFPDTLSSRSSSESAPFSVAVAVAAARRSPRPLLSPDIDDIAPPGRGGSALPSSSAFEPERTTLRAALLLL